MRNLLKVISLALITSCGNLGGESTKTVTWENPLQPTTVLMCQEGSDRPVEFEINNSLYFQACLGFRPCQGTFGNWYYVDNSLSEEYLDEAYNELCEVDETDILKPIILKD